MPKQTIIDLDKEYGLPPIKSYDRGKGNGNGKGDHRRPPSCSSEHFRSEWERIFGACTNDNPITTKE